LVQDFLQNTEDLIQEVASHSRWEFFEVRHLFAKFRSLNDTKQNSSSLTRQQFEKFLPCLFQSLFINFEQFSKSEYYNRWYPHLLNTLQYHDDKDNGIKFDEFVKYLENGCRSEPLEKAKLLFTLFDIDEDNTWNETEFSLFLEHVFGYHYSSKDTQQQQNNNTDNNESNLNGNANVKPVMAPIDYNKIFNRENFINYIDLLIKHEKK